MNLSTVKWTQWDKTQSRELLGLFMSVQFTVYNMQKKKKIKMQPVKLRFFAWPTRFNQYPAAQFHPRYHSG